MEFDEVSVIICTCDFLGMLLSKVVKIFHAAATFKKLFLSEP